VGPGELAMRQVTKEVTLDLLDRATVPAQVRANVS